MGIFVDSVYPPGLINICFAEISYKNPPKPGRVEVELEGVEPSSKQAAIMLSTCLAFLIL